MRRTISFKTVRITTLAILQPRGFDFPYGKWALTPRGVNLATLTVSTPTRDLKIEIGEGTCTLAGPA